MPHVCLFASACMRAIVHECVLVCVCAYRWKDHADVLALLGCVHIAHKRPAHTCMHTCTQCMCKHMPLRFAQNVEPSRHRRESTNMDNIHCGCDAPFTLYVVVAPAHGCM